MRIGRRRVRWGWIVGVVFIAWTAGIWILIPRDLSLISRATLLVPAGKALPFEASASPFDRSEPGPFFWMSDHELMYSNPDQAICRYDTLTGVSTNIESDDHTLAVFEARRKSIENRNDKDFFIHQSGKLYIDNRDNRGLALPLQGTVLDSALSPAGDRRAWLLEVDHISPLQVFLKRLWPSLAARTRHQAGLWVSRADGTDMHLLGFMPLMPGIRMPGPFFSGPPEQWPWDLQWKPDGKRLSFLYKGALYSIPAD